MLAEDGVWRERLGGEEGNAPMVACKVVECEKNHSDPGKRDRGASEKGQEASLIEFLKRLRERKVGECGEEEKGEKKREKETVVGDANLKKSEAGKELKGEQGEKGLDPTGSALERGLGKQE